MHIAYKAYCRAFQAAFHLAIPFLPYREPKMYKSIADIPTILQERGVKSALLVTDHGLRSGKSTAVLEDGLQAVGIRCAVYDHTCANPTIHNVEEAREMYIREKCEALIAFGGGSSIDCAKAVGARIAYPKKSLQQLGGLLRVLRKIPTLIAVPTTAGTGSEVTVTAVITDSEKKHKYTMNDFTLIPSYAVLDPAVTVSLPPSLTATTGMDALTHAVEAYIGRSTTKETRKLALEAVRLIFANIENAYQNGADLVARENMLHAAYLAGIAFSKSYVGYIHAVAHTFGGQYNTPHGLANAVILPTMLEAYGATVHKKLHTLGCAAGVCTEADTYAQGAQKFIAAIRLLNSRMQIPEKLFGGDTADIPAMAAHAAREANPLYPVPVLMDEKQLASFYTQVADWSK